VALGLLAVLRKGRAAVALGLLAVLRKGRAAVALGLLAVLRKENSRKIHKTVRMPEGRNQDTWLLQRRT